MPSPPSGSRREDYDGKDVCTEGGSDGRIDSGTRGIVIRHTRTIFAALIKIAYFINQEELDRVGETGKERVSVYFDKIFGAELELGARGTVEVTFVGRVDNLAGTGKTEI